MLRHTETWVFHPSKQVNPTWKRDGGLRFAYIAPLTQISKWLVFFSAIPIAIFVNLLRLTATAIMAHRIGAMAAEGFLHEMSGLVAFVLLFLISLVLTKIEGRVKKGITTQK